MSPSPLDRFLALALAAGLGLAACASPPAKPRTKAAPRPQPAAEAHPAAAASSAPSPAARGAAADSLDEALRQTSASGDAGRPAGSLDRAPEPSTPPSPARPAPEPVSAGPLASAGSGASGGEPVDDAPPDDDEAAGASAPEDEPAPAPLPPKPSTSQDPIAATLPTLGARRVLPATVRSTEVPVLCPPNGTRDAHPYTAVVTKVVDGDTVWLDDRLKVRLIGLNTAERGEDLYKAAGDLVRSMVEGREVVVETDRNSTDAYGRGLVYLFADGRLVNAEVIRHGLAYCYLFAPNNRYDPQLLALQKLAREDDLGLWSLPEPSPPAERVDEKGEPYRYLAGRRESRFHRPDCDKLGAGTPRRFATRDAAFDSGRCPCRFCEP